MQDFEIGLLRRLNQLQAFCGSLHYHAVRGLHRDSGLSIQGENHGVGAGGDDDLHDRGVAHDNGTVAERVGADGRDDRAFN